MRDYMKLEILELRIKLCKQDSLLQSPAELLKTIIQQKESTEQFIFNQQTLGVLKVRANLEVWKPLHQSEPRSPFQNHFHLSSECAGDS